MSPKKFDAVEYLKTDEDVWNYLSSVAEENDPVLMAAALDDIKRALNINDHE